MCHKNSCYLVVAFYKLVTIEDPKLEVMLHKRFFEGKEITSRIYLSEEGINGQMSGKKECIQEYIEWMKTHPKFTDVHFKIHKCSDNVFPRQTVKYRKNLVGSDQKIDLSKRGFHVSPKRWKDMLESNKNYLILDVRNSYEYALGHFARAVNPNCDTFRRFALYAKKLKEDFQKNPRPIMMSCTGGIRCELFSSILMEQGIDKIYQLEGGVINYGLEIGSKHWLGKLFVFDDRLSIPISDEETPIIGSCHRCENQTESYYNCANMECNALFLSCQPCLNALGGCCKKACQQAENVRPFHHSTRHIPFRRKHLAFS